MHLFGCMSHVEPFCCRGAREVPKLSGIDCCQNCIYTLHQSQFMHNNKVLLACLYLYLAGLEWVDNHILCICHMLHTYYTTYT